MAKETDFEENLEEKEFLFDSFDDEKCVWRSISWRSSYIIATSVAFLAMIPLSLYYRSKGMLSDANTVFVIAFTVFFARYSFYIIRSDWRVSPARLVPDMHGICLPGFYRKWCDKNIEIAKTVAKRYFRWQIPALIIMFYAAFFFVVYL